MKPNAKSLKVMELHARMITGGHPDPRYSKPFKTPEPQRKHARNYYRRKKDIPLDAPLRTRSEPFNKRRRGSGNQEGKVSMSPGAWEILDQIKGDYHRGEFLELLVREAELAQLEKKS
jgi:hypothetical protein